MSHIYVESAVWDHPRTARVKARFPKAQFVEIEHQRELTQRRGAVWSYQKRTPKLVLAAQSEPHLYPCSEVAPDFGHPNFYYSVPMQNCLYDCEYCYLQGMYTSPHMVLYVNQEEMWQAVRDKTRDLGSLYLCIAYDNDLLAMESKLGLVAEWVEALRATPQATIEVRTKSANFRALKDLTPSPSVILAWTLSPAAVIHRFEAKTPPFQARLDSMLAALAAGWRVRLCLDPLLPIVNWRQEYESLFEALDATNLWAQLEDASYGTFRMNRDFLRQARKARPESTLIHGATARDERGLLVLSHPELQELLDTVGDGLKSRMDPAKVYLT